MKQKINAVFILGIFILGIGVVAASTEATTVKINVDPAEISFSVPDEIDFGTLTQGYQSDEIEFYVNNTGEIDIRVETSLDENYEGDVFENLKFRKNGTTTTKTLSSFYLTIDKPDEIGEVVSQLALTWLDLTKYNENMNATLEEETSLIFTAMPD